MGIQINNKQVLDMNYLGKKAYSAVLNGDYVFASTLKKVSGTQNNIKDAAALPINKLYLEGNSYQETTSGKNLLSEQPTSSNTTAQYSSLTKTDYIANLKKGETYTLSFDTKPSGIVCYFQSLSGFELTYKEFTCDGTRKFVTFTPTSDLTSIHRNTVSRKTATNTTGTGDISNIQIAQGTDIDYEPYTNGPTHNPDYPQEVEVIEGSVDVEVVGKNILSTDMFIDNVVPTINGGQNVSVPGNTSTSYIEIDNSLPLVLSMPQTIKTKYAFYYDESYNFIGHKGNANLTYLEVSKTEYYQNAKYIRVRVDGSLKATMPQIQLEYNETATAYEPYKKLTLNSRNICPSDISDWELGQWNDKGIKNTYQNRVRVNRLIPCKPNTTYYFNTFSTTIYYVIRTFKQDESFNTSIGIIYPTHSITTDANTYYLGVTIYDSVNTTNDLLSMIENGTIKPFICLNSETDKTYEPYGKPSIDLQDNFIAKLGDVKDELDVVTGKLTKKIGKLVLNGSETWESVGSMNTDDIHCYAYTNVFDKLFSTNASDFKYSMCNRLPYINGLWAGLTIDKEVFSITSGMSRLRIAIKKTRLSSVSKSGLSAYLSENPITIYYVLAEPYEVQLDITKIPLFEGINNIKINTNSEPSLTELDYYIR